MRFLLRILSVGDLLRLQKLLIDELQKKLPHEEKVRLLWNKTPYNPKRSENVPGSPSNDDVLTYQRYLKNPKSNVLLLGSTPTLRQMLNDIGIKNYVISDFSGIALKSSLQMMKGVDPQNEIILISSWLRMPLRKNYFNYIIGDLITSQISIEKQRDLMKNLSDLLVEGGKCVCRVHTFDDSIQYDLPQKIIKDFIHKGEHKQSQNAKFILLYKLRDAMRNEATQTTSPSKIMSEILNYTTSDPEEMEFLKSIAEDLVLRAEINIDYITQSLNEFKETVHGIFEVEEVSYAEDYSESNHFPIFSLKKC